MEKTPYVWKLDHNEPAYLPTPEEIEAKCKTFRERHLRLRKGRDPDKEPKDVRADD